MAIIQEGDAFQLDCRHSGESILFPLAVSHLAPGSCLTGRLDSDVVFVSSHYSSCGELINVSVVRSVALSWMVIWGWLGGPGSCVSQAYYCNCTIQDPWGVSVSGRPSRVMLSHVMYSVLSIMRLFSSMVAYTRHIIVLVRWTPCLCPGKSNSDGEIAWVKV